MKELKPKVIPPPVMPPPLDDAVVSYRLEAVEKKMDAVIATVENLKQPRPVNWLMLVGTFISFLGVMLATIVAVCSAGWLWLNIRLQPLEIQVAANEKSITDVREEARKAIEETGKYAESRLSFWNNDTKNNQKNLEKDIQRIYSKVFEIHEQPASSSNSK